MCQWPLYFGPRWKWWWNQEGKSQSGTAVLNRFDKHIINNRTKKSWCWPDKAGTPIPIVHGHNQKCIEWWNGLIYAWNNFAFWTGAAKSYIWHGGVQIWGASEIWGYEIKNLWALDVYGKELDRKSGERGGSALPSEPTISKFEGNDGQLLERRLWQCTIRQHARRLPQLHNRPANNHQKDEIRLRTPK